MSSATHRFVYPLGTAPGGQDIQALNYLQNPFIVSALVDVVSGSASYSVEFTMNDLDGDPTLFRWTSLPSAPPGQTATALYTLSYPVTGIRLNLSANTGEVRFTVIQAPGSL
jgi:hypothetical protein